ncbi:MAG: hypothetical protein H0X65_07880 [Gemmatimonadetes bacterium]|nr:hypothetical protein [Gemmatimonadota bacterium]
MRKMMGLTRVSLSLFVLAGILPGAALAQSTGDTLQPDESSDLGILYTNNPSIRSGLRIAAQPKEDPTSLLRFFRREFSRVPVTVVLVPHLEFPDAEAVVLRRSSGAGHDIILLEEARADAGRLAAAVASLFWHRRNQGLKVPNDITIEVRAEHGPQRWAAIKPNFEAKVQELHTATEQAIPGFSRVRAIQLQRLD